ncbi:hypothetical protein GS506_05210 [Rhodococcus hoagii]|nr:hypothetical protein [Prescottella equi]
MREDGQGVDRVVESAVVDRVGALRCAHRALFLLRERKLPLFPVSSRSNPQDEKPAGTRGNGARRRADGSLIRVVHRGFVGRFDPA